MESWFIFIPPDLFYLEDIPLVKPEWRFDLGGTELFETHVFCLEITAFFEFPSSTGGLVRGGGGGGIGRAN